MHVHLTELHILSGERSRLSFKVKCQIYAVKWRSRGHCVFLKNAKCSSFQTVVFRPTEHKGFTVKPQGKDKSVGAMPVMSDVGTDPTCFESESSDAEDDEMNDAYVADDADDDPEWEPEDDSDEEYESGDEENVW
ncbi:hypothetical protein DPMN_018131 [Dreissena polymorpha]|uniref:Uncharacterized protein n=1 Tax=Dreissena polymorpha TaxID=45954 RepID=A0A9D4NG08_DREPO|nr:hypothetical protein DPMN_018131 [Dreissena polymorpha]